MLAGSGAGAMVLCDPMVDPRGGAFTLGLGLVAQMAGRARADTWSEDKLHRTLQLAPAGVPWSRSTSARRSSATPAALAVRRRRRGERLGGRPARPTCGASRVVRLSGRGAAPGASARRRLDVDDVDVERQRGVGRDRALPSAP